MIDMKQPSLVLHSHDVPGYKYKMWATWNVPDKMPVSTLVDWIIWAIDHSPNLRLDNVVINCHGSPGYLHIGSGIGVNNLDPFTRLRNKGAIGTIWIVACQVSDGKYMPNACPVDSNNGPYFCSRLAAAAGCYVVASDKTQYVDIGYYLALCPWGYIDDYEGNVYRYSPGKGGGREMISQSGQ